MNARSRVIGGAVLFIASCLVFAAGNIAAKIVVLTAVTVTLAAVADRCRRERDDALEMVREVNGLLVNQSRAVALVAHDLRHPLAGIKAYSQMLSGAERFDTGQIASVFSKLTDETSYADGLTRDLLAASLAHDTAEAVMVESDLASDTWEATAAWRKATPGRPISVQAPDHALLRAPERWGRRLLDNLLANALSHSPDHTPVKVEVRQSRNATLLSVTNTSEGPLPDDAFVARKSGAGSLGSGLGLHTVHAMVRALGGSIDTRYVRDSKQLTLTLRLPHQPDPARTGSGASAGSGVPATSAQPEPEPEPGRQVAADADDELSGAA